MKVKIGSDVYDANKEPILLILSNDDKTNIKNMLVNSHRFCAAPETMTAEEIEKFMTECLGCAGKGKRPAWNGKEFVSTQCHQCDGTGNAKY